MKKKRRMLEKGRWRDGVSGIKAHLAADAPGAGAAVAAARGELEVDAAARVVGALGVLAALDGGGSAGHGQDGEGGG